LRYINDTGHLPLVIEVKLPELRIGEYESFDRTRWHQSIHRDFQHLCDRSFLGDVIGWDLFVKEEDLVELTKKGLSDSAKSSGSEAEVSKGVLSFAIGEGLIAEEH